MHLLNSHLNGQFNEKVLSAKIRQNNLKLSTYAFAYSVHSFHLHDKMGAGHSFLSPGPVGLIGTFYTIHAFLSRDVRTLPLICFRYFILSIIFCYKPGKVEFPK